MEAPPTTPSLASVEISEEVALAPTSTWLVVVAGRRPEPLKKVQFTSVPPPPPDWSVPQLNCPLSHRSLSAEVPQVESPAPYKEPDTVSAVLDA